MASSPPPRPCPVCGKSFRPTNQQLRKGNGLHCSRACRGITQQKRTDHVCQHCGKVFPLFAAAASYGLGKFCSRECRTAAWRERGKTNTRRASEGLPATVPCSTCGVETAMRSDHFRRNGGKLYCSTTCAGIGRRRAYDPTSRSGRQYKAWRIAVLRRDKFTCQRCGFVYNGTPKSVAAHHIEGWTARPDLRFEVSNGVTLCHPCHVITHEGTPSPLAHR